MLVVPTSRIILLKNPIEIDYMNELTFSNLNAQYNYFYNLPKLECDNATYQRKDEVVRFPTDPNMEGVTYDDLIEYNYCMYQNDKWSDKWFYAFVKSVTFDNPGMSYIELETDIWQSWMFDITFKPSFIEREHVNDDTVGLHTIPENLELGEYVTQEATPISIFSDDPADYYIVLGVTKYPGTTAVPGDNTGGKIYAGVFSGLAYIVGEDFSGTTNIIRSYSDVGGADSIQCIFVAPKYLCGTPDWHVVAGWSYNVKYGVLPEQEDEWGATSLVTTKPTTLAGNYTPVNKKLLTWPYCYMNVDTNVGNCIDYRYEDFSTNNINFNVMATLTPGTSYKISPNNYKGLVNNYLYRFTPTKLPICNWQSDVYTNWITQNAVNVGLSVAGSGISLVASAVTGNPIGIASGVLGIASSIGQIYEHSLIPPSVKGNLNSGDVSFASKVINPILYKMSIKPEYSAIIDKYFSAYGYKVNTYKTPNINGRSNWNYVKTIGCNIIGDIPQNDLQKIKDIFNNGVTFWHNPSTFLDYSQNNTIV